MKRSETSQMNKCSKRHAQCIWRKIYMSSELLKYLKKIIWSFMGFRRSICIVFGCCWSRYINASLHKHTHSEYRVDLFCSLLCFVFINCKRKKHHLLYKMFDVAFFIYSLVSPLLLSFYKLFYWNQFFLLHISLLI